MIQIDEIGVIYAPAVPSDYLDDAGMEYDMPPEALAGYHVNTTHPVAEWAAFKVTPTTPRRVFGGIPTHFYTFASKAEFDTLLEGVDLDPVIVPVPQSVTMRQARLALLGAGKLAGVTAAISALPSPQKEAAQIEWEYSQTVERHRGFVLLLGAALGLTDAQLDGLFIAAAGL